MLRALAGVGLVHIHAEVLSAASRPRACPRDIPASVFGSAELHPCPHLPVLIAAGPHSYMVFLNHHTDSFSARGQHAAVLTRSRAGQAMVAAGADILDIGGESTRPRWPIFVPVPKR